MARSGKTWLWGCGAGCLAVVVLLVVLFGGGAFFLRDTLQGWQAASTAQEELRRVHGDAGSFRPDGDGGLRRERIEAFLAVQSRIATPIDDLLRSVLAAPDRRDQGAGRLARFWRTAEAGMRVGTSLADFKRAHAEALLEAGMSPGEYNYLYSVVYHCWLGHDPAAGVEDLAVALDQRSEGKVSMQFGRTHFESGDPQAMAGRVRRQVCDQHRQWLRAQLQASDPQDAARPDWPGILREELAALEDDDQCVPWRRTFPAPWAAVLEPYAAQLEAGWSERDNPVLIFLAD